MYVCLSYSCSKFWKLWLHLCFACTFCEYQAQVVISRSLGRGQGHSSKNTLCLKKVPTFKLFVTLSNLNRFSKFFALLESVWNLRQSTYNTTRLTLSTLLHYLGKLKIQIFYRYSADTEENANKLHFKKLPTFEIRLLISLLCTPSNTNFLSKSCPRRWISCWLLTNTAVMSAATNFRCHKLIAEVNK